MIKVFVHYSLFSISVTLYFFIIIIYGTASTTRLLVFNKTLYYYKLFKTKLKIGY